MVNQLKIDVAKTGHPISKYVYGQFIEHLGRSIYGGLWAEMILDRKFFYPVSDQFDPWGSDVDKQWNSGAYKFLKASPWKVMGTAGSVSSDGEHPVTIRGNDAGILQDGLAVVGGKKYVGRIVLAGKAAVEVRLVIEGQRAVSLRFDRIGPEFQTYPLEFVAPVSTENARLEIVGADFQIAAVSLMPADHLKGWRADVVALLRELDSPIYRWPGGNFVSGYDWRDGIGDPDKRPTRKNPAWKSIEANDVGIHEFMQLMEMIASEPYIALNTGLGTTELAIKEVEYCNGSIATPMGKLRAENGHPEPFKIVWWAVGNEMYGDWQLGFMPLAEYAKKHNLMADAVWKVDPAAKLVAVGHIGEWDQTILAECADRMTLIAEHTYSKEKADLAEHVGQLAVSIREIAEAHRKYQQTIPAMAGRKIEIALDEWNYWYGDYVFGELGCRYHLKDGLGVARGLHEMFRHSDLFFMANYAQTVNVLGAIKTTETHSSLETTGLVLKMYRNHFGTIPIQIVEQPEGLDVAAAWTKDRSAITIAAVNWGEERVITLRMDPHSNPLPEYRARGKDEMREVDLRTKLNGTRWVMTGPGAESFNEPGKAAVCEIVEMDMTIGDGILEVPKMAVVLYRLEIGGLRRV